MCVCVRERERERAFSLVIRSLKMCYKSRRSLSGGSERKGDIEKEREKEHDLEDQIANQRGQRWRS